MSTAKPYSIDKWLVYEATRASLFLEGISERQPHLFVHWQRGMVGAFA